MPAYRLMCTNDGAHTTTIQSKKEENSDMLQHVCTLEDIMLSEKSKSQNYCMISSMRQVKVTFWKQKIGW